MSVEIVCDGKLYGCCTESESNRVVGSTEHLVLCES